MTKLEAQLLSDLLKEEWINREVKDKKSRAETKTIIDVAYVHENVADENGWKVYVLFPLEFQSGQDAQQRCELNLFYKLYSLIE